MHLHITSATSGTVKVVGRLQSHNETPRNKINTHKSTTTVCSDSQAKSCIGLTFSTEVLFSLIV